MEEEGREEGEERNGPKGWMTDTLSIIKAPIGKGTSASVSQSPSQSAGGVKTDGFELESRHKTGPISNPSFSCLHLSICVLTRVYGMVE